MSDRCLGAQLERTRSAVPIAEAFIEIEAANLMRYNPVRCSIKANRVANMAKYLAAKASWEAGNACIQFHGGFGFACEYDIERKFRETRLYQVALFLLTILSYIAEHVLGATLFEWVLLALIIKSKRQQHH